MREWLRRADETFLAEMPGRRRIMCEIALLLALVYAAQALLVSNLSAVLIVGAELGFALALTQPWAAVHGGALGRALATLVVVLAVVAPACIERPVQGRRLGVVVSPAGPVARVDSVTQGTPAAGVLAVGDRIVSVAGQPLAAEDPVGDLTHRTHSDELPVDTTVTVDRAGARLDLPVHVPRVRASLDTRLAAVRELASRHIVVASALRGALVIGLLLVLLRRDGQPLRTIGLVREGALRELGAASWMTAGTFAVQVVVAIPVGLLGAALGTLSRENQQRTETLGAIASQGPVLEFALAAVVAAAFEEVAFRGFLVPRLRALTGSWAVAIGIGAALFGVGHAYEGALATVQTAFLGAWFAMLLLVRQRLVGPTVAHALFNIVMMLVIRLVTSTHVIERLQQSLPH